MNRAGLPLEVIAAMLLATIVLCFLLKGRVRSLERFLSPMYWLPALSALPLLYLASAGFLDHAESSQICQALPLLYGEEIYSDISRGDPPSLPYGPYIHLLVAAAAAVTGDPLIGPKLLSFALLAATILLTAAAIRNEPQWRAALAVFSASLLVSGPPIFWIRPEPILLFSTSVAVWSLGRKTITRILLTGAALGIATSLKLFSPIYFLPLLLIPGARLLHVAGSVAIAALAFCLPWLMPGASWDNYYASLSIQTASRFIPGVWLSGGLLAAFFTLPLFSQSTNRIWLLPLALSLTAAVAVSGKDGGGSYYLIPLLPIIASHISRTTMRDNVLAGWLLSAGFGALLMQGWGMRLLTATAASGRSSVELILACLPESSVAFGQTGDKQYDLTSFRPLICARTGTNELDPAMLMEQRRYQAEPSGEGVTALARGNTEAVILPAAGEPFSLKSLYQPFHPVFGSTLPGAFLQRYERSAVEGPFALWLARSMPEMRKRKIVGCIVAQKHLRSP